MRLAQVELDALGARRREAARGDLLAGVDRLADDVAVGLRQLFRAAGTTWACATGTVRT